jgi:hypothetical protein
MQLTSESVTPLVIVGATPAVVSALVAPVMVGDGEPLVVTSAKVASFAAALRLVTITVVPELLAMFDTAKAELALSAAAIFGA